MDPDSAMPEKGILKKNSSLKLALNDCDSICSISKSDQDSVGPYMYDEDEDAEADEIQKIFKDESMDNLDQLQDSASFDFVIPPPPQPPPPQYALPDYYPSSISSKHGQQVEISGGAEYESPYAIMSQHESPYTVMNPQSVQVLPQQPAATWRTALPPQTLSPPQSRIVKLKNPCEYMQGMNKVSIDLSPSPTTQLSQQLTPSTNTSEDVHSGSSDPDRMLSQSDHSPTQSINSTSTQHTAGTRPSYGSLSQYLLKRNESVAKPSDETADLHSIFNNKHRDLFTGNGEPPGGGNSALTQYLQHHNDLNIYRPKLQVSGEEAPAVDMPPPMQTLNIRTMYGLTHTPGSTASRDSNNTPQGSACGDNFSYVGTGNSKNGYEKSSGYGSEMDQERFMDELTSRSDSQSRSTSLSRSHSSSPPSYSAVIRTGPNRIELVPAGQLIEEGREIEGIQQELNRLLENLPRINAGSFERSPLQSSMNPGLTPTGPHALYNNTGSPHTGAPLDHTSGSPYRKPSPTTYSKPSPMTHTKPSTTPHTTDNAHISAQTPCINESLNEIPSHHFSDTAWSGRVPGNVSAHGKKASPDGSLDEIESLLDDNEKPL